MNQFSYEPDNDTGSNDESYYEFYRITDSEGNYFAQAESEHNAALICGLLNKYTGWTASKVQCNFCSHDWIAAFHITNEKLECPNCGNMTSYEIPE